ncbi:hypothetical protein RvY_15684 [Ramazzottius varieornatus]|uniref:Cytosolic endo-beta-N-acetylglucosaminidase TIM barrel domain-containing protein n=1 Tax=Ramazzottius varieornatus TaxID=947166 RepID=A0A1D1W3P0_RAMVA|nr:hypothetical protein RvY_15684 [Ramazzottius varieornatus]
MSSDHETRPLRTLNGLLEWKAMSLNDSPVIVPLGQKNAWTQSVNQPRTLLCHDMKGGYLADRFTHGSLVGVDEPYLFYHWSHIHGFIYFSHNFVTIPPVGWINAAHRNGVMVFGTLITEWDDGKAIWLTLLSDDALLKRTASQLVKIAEEHHLDGWLVNVENSIEPTDVDKVAAFLRKLRSPISLNGKSRRLTIIWYDSITIKGDLKWQNALNDYNMKFFQFADGIFLNYNWKFEDLVASKATAGNFRQYDVFVGVDCFGRGCHGGGGWNTSEALRVIREHDMSVALFAPGWVLECNDASCFQENQEKFWLLMSPYLPSHKIVEELPLKTSFCVGYGRRKFAEGLPVDCPSELSKHQSEKCEELTHWYNLNEQNIQPVFHANDSTRTEDACSKRHCFGEAWSGGGCLELSTSSTKSVTRWTLFQTAIPLKNTVVVDITVKAPAQGELRGIRFGLEIVIGERMVLCLCGGQAQCTSTGSEESRETLLPARCCDLNSVVPGASWCRYEFVLPACTEDQTTVMDRISFHVHRDDRSEDRALRFLLGQLRISEATNSMLQSLQ